MRDGERALRIMLRPIQPILADPGVTEVCINRAHEVGVEKAGKWSWIEVEEYDFDRLDAMGILAGFTQGKHFDESYPFCNTTLPDGQRVQLCRPNGTLPGVVSFTIRKPATKARRVEDDDFQALFSLANLPKGEKAEADAELLKLYHAGRWQEFFVAARRARKTICTCGSMLTGKTDLLKRLLQLTNPDTRVVTVESDPEFGHLGPRNKLNLFYNEDHPEMTPEKVIKVVLRTRADEIWFQEVRGAEAFAYLRALISGHRGGGTSWHAEEGEEFDALETMVRQHPAGRALPDDRIRLFLRACIDVVVSCSRTSRGFGVSRVWFKAAEIEEGRMAA